MNNNITNPATAADLLPAEFFSKPFGERLRHLRTAADITQKEIARQLHVDRSTYSYYEIGKTEPRISTLNILSRIFNVPLDVFLRDL